MFFQFSPPTRQAPKKRPQEKAQPEPTIVTLAPFTPNPKVFFENVKVGTTSVETLVIKNPSSGRLDITAQISLDEDVNLNVRWTHQYLESNEEAPLDLIWNPTRAGSWRFILKICAGSKLNKDIPIVLKSTSTAEKKHQKSKPPRFLVRKSPSPVKKLSIKSPRKRLALPNITNMPKIVISPQPIANGKENVFSGSIGVDRRETFTVGEPHFQDSLEDSFETRLASELFVLTNQTPSNKEFEPVLHSTEEKSLIKSESTGTNCTTCLFPESNNETFEIVNISGKTYTAEISYQDEVIQHLHPSSRSRLNNLTGHSIRDILEADLWSKHPGRPLSMIKEEHQPIKRKAEETFLISPKRPNLSQAPTDWTTKKTVTVIDPETTIFLEKQQENFKKWLNCILTPPALTTNETQPIDIANLWRQVQKKKTEVVIVPATACARLALLRTAMMKLYKTAEIQDVLKKVFSCIEMNRLSVRKDRDIHLDLAIQSEIMRVILSYNPLWLRLGLETIFNRVIPLRSNSDIIGITNFLSEHLIRNSKLLKKYKSPYSPVYVIEIKKHILKKFLSLVYLLDKGKMAKIIPHDPCLFCKNAPIKESRESLICFSREVLSAMGDVTKYLKQLKYTVEYSQAYLDEFEYTVNCLGVDLRDGVRLTRVLEIILLEENLRKNLRVPAISRLQKIHNIKLVLAALTRHNFQLIHDISYKDLVDGHKEKTLSFLWQLIYKFHTPVMAKSVTTITAWWRSDTIKIKREELKEIRRRKEEEIRKVVVKIQSYVRMYLQRKTFFKMQKSASLIQDWYRSSRKMLHERESFLNVKSSILLIQRRYKAKKQMENDFKKYQELKNLVIVIQRLYRMKQERKRFLQTREAAIKIQQSWKGYLKMQKQHQEFIILKATTIIIQRRFRALVEMKRDLYYYEVLKRSVILVQRAWRGKMERRKFENLKNAVIVLQRSFRAKRERNNFIKFTKTVIFIQRKWRAKMMMKRQFEEFTKFKYAALIIQKCYRARIQSKSYQKLKTITIFVQRTWKLKIQARVERERFEKMRNAAIVIQRWLKARNELRKYQELKKTTLVIQRQWRARQMMIKSQKDYQQLRNAAIVIQKNFRAKCGRDSFLKLKKSVVFIQRKRRATVVMKSHLEEFTKLKTAVLIMQKCYRARIQFMSYQKLKSKTIFVQRTWRLKIQARNERKRFEEMRNASILIQRRFRAQISRNTELRKYEELKKATLVIQRQWRAHQMKIKSQKDYQKIRNAAIVIQKNFRAKCGRDSFLKLQKSVICIQRKRRATVMMRNQLEDFTKLKYAALTIQKCYRARIQLKSYQKLKYATIFVQKTWKLKIQTRIAKKRFDEMRKAAIVIQRQFRTINELKKYQQLKNATLAVQRQWRARQMKIKAQKEYQQLRNAAIVIQKNFRAKCGRNTFLKLKKSVIFIQRKRRATVIMKNQLEEFTKLKTAVLIMQKCYRTRIQFMSYQKLKSITIFVQRTWRLKIQARNERKRFEEMRNAAIIIQQRFRAQIFRNNEFKKYNDLKKATVIIQRQWRAHQMKNKAYQEYQNLRNATIVIQSLFKRRIQQQKYEKYREIVIYIQQIWRAKILTRIERKRFLQMKKSILKIQYHSRIFLQKKQEIQLFKNNQLFMNLQRYARGYLVRKRYSLFLSLESVMERRELRKKNNAARNIQAAWRGYKLRCKQPEENRQILERLKQANEGAAPEKTLGRRCKTAIDKLKGKNVNLKEILLVLNDLDYITRRCQKSLKKLSASVLPHYLYKTILATNRSVHEMQVSTAAASILINFYRYEATRETVWLPEFLESVITIMLRWCDNDSPLFPTLCTLIWFFLHDEAKKTTIMQTVKFHEKITQIKERCERKEKMIKKMNVNKNHSFFVEYVAEELALPDFSPDWGLKLTNKPRVFANSCQAFKCIWELLF